MKEIVVSNLMRAKNKQSFFALHQLQSKIKALYPDVKVEFHILWDNIAEGNMGDNDKWSQLIDEKIENLYSYDKEFFDNYTIPSDRNYDIYGIKYESFWNNISMFNQVMRIPDIKELYPPLPLRFPL